LKTANLLDLVIVVLYMLAMVSIGFIFMRFNKGASDYFKGGNRIPWLVAALQGSKPGDAAAPDLLTAAREVKSDSPAFITVNYHRVRLLPPDDARALADKLLAGKMPTSARNQIRAERMSLARNFEEFLRYAPRRPVTEVVEEVSPVDAEDR